VAYAITDFVRDRQAKHAHTIEALLSAHARLRDQVKPAAISVLKAVETSPAPWLVPWRGAIASQAQRIWDGLTSFEGLLATLIGPIQIPLWMWRNAERWTEVEGALTRMVGDLNITNREVHLRWQGAAAEAYDKILPAHVAAAAQLGTTADTIQHSLTWAATAVAIFYAALLAIVIHFIGGFIVAMAAAVTVAFEVFALVEMLMVVAAAVVELAALVAVSTEVFGRMKIWMIELQSELNDNSAFPNGRWPLSRADWYSDATVTDGDADWSVVR
jgi:hypothetical protein